MFNSLEQRCDDQSESLSNCSKAKITDLNFDCLEHVFGYLNASELNNIAEAYLYFVPVARSVYRIKYGDKTLKIGDSGRSLSMHNEMGSSKTIINGTATKFLRNFGYLIRKLSLDYLNKAEHEDAHHWREIENAIFKHCIKSLWVVEFKNCRGNVMEEIRKPFENVGVVTIIDGFTEPTKTDFCNWFPNTYNLVLRGTAIRNSECMNGSFHALGYLVLSILEQDDIAEANIRKFLQLNRNIVQLVIRSKERDWIQVSVDFLKFLSESPIQNLQLINVNFKRAYFTQIINFQYVESLQLQTSHYPDNILITFGQMTRLGLFGIQRNSKWIEFVTRNKKLRHLTYRPQKNHGATLDDLIQIATKLPELNTFEVLESFISFDELIQLLEMCEPILQLRTIEIRFANGDLKDELRQFANRKGNEFKSAFEYEGSRSQVAVFKRKSD